MYAFCVSSLLFLSAGSAVEKDLGYWNAPKESGGRWVSLPTKLVLVGVADEDLAKACCDCYVFRTLGRELAGNSHFVHKNARIIQLGLLPKISIQDIKVGIQK